jgi:hypothetical protein
MRLLENGTQLFIVAPPIYKEQKTLSTKLKWYLTTVEPDVCMKERTYTHVSALTTIQLSVRGYVKYQFNTETHRNYLFKHRSSDVQSAEYSASQEFYIERGAKNNER